MSQVAKILAAKGNRVITIEGESTVFDAVQKMVEHNVGSLMVTENGEFCGILTERDYLRRIVVEGRTSKTTLVREVMTQDLVCVEPTSSVEECMGVMTQKRIRHLPVVDGSQLVGMVSIGDLVKSFSQDKEIEVRYLEDYISGKYPG